MSIYALTLIAASVLGGCTANNDDTATTGDGGAADGGAADGGTADGGGADGGGDTGTATVALTLGFSEFFTQAPVVGATVTQGSDTQTTDASGNVTFQVQPNTNISLKLTADGYHDFYIYRPVGSIDWSTTLGLASDASISSLATALGITIDPSKALVNVNVLQGDLATGNSQQGGATVDLDASYDVALVTDAKSTYGISPGNTTLDGSQAAVVFVNADPGTITSTITPPTGTACDLGSNSFDVPAGAFGVASVYCHAK